MKDTVKVRSLRPYEQQKLHRLKRQLANAVNRCHARIVLLSRGGLRNRVIAEHVGCSPQWVRRIIHRFNDHGLDGILWLPYHHAGIGPRCCTADIVEQVAEVALSSPKALIGMNRWSLAKLRTYLVEQGILARISLEWLRTLLRRCHVRWRHTKTWKESTDPQFWEKYQRLRRLDRRRPAGGRRLCVDEFGPLNLQPRHGTCCTGPGRRVQRHRATYHRNGGVRHFLAVYDLETNRLLGVFKRRKRWQEFLSFLRWLRRRYAVDETLHIVLDNYGPHIKTEVLAWALQKNVRFYLTPTNASWLNRIECEFTALKEFALSNSDHRTHTEQQEAIDSYLRWRNGRRQLSIQSWKEYRQKRKTPA